ncbi:hypothetical protein SESBI_00886 [Sesbania bispinosa]|nr:hypothetical protein SESBI_00886 [Sesbania bispinosa]
MNISLAKVRDLSFNVSISWPNHAPCVVRQSKGNDGFVVGCANWGLGTEVEIELEAEMKSQEDEEQISEMM